MNESNIIIFVLGLSGLIIVCEAINCCWRHWKKSRKDKPPHHP